VLELCSFCRDVPCRTSSIVVGPYA
jgi:hypothetical protein